MSFTVVCYGMLLRKTQASDLTVSVSLAQTLFKVRDNFNAGDVLHTFAQPPSLFANPGIYIPIIWTQESEHQLLMHIYFVNAK